MKVTAARGHENCQKLDGVVVIAPLASEVATLSSCLGSSDVFDWQACALKPTVLNRIKAALRTVRSTCPSIDRFVSAIRDPHAGAAVWDMHEVADNEQHRRLLVVVATALGIPFGAFERWGFWKGIGVNPKIDPSRVEGVGFIPFHQDFINAVRPPDIVMLRCIRTDELGASLVANIDAALARLDPHDRTYLSKRVMREGAYYELHGLGGERNPFPILERHEHRLSLRFTAKVIPSLRPSKLRTALSALESALMAVRERHELRAGQTLFINQHFVCHGRDPLAQPVRIGPDARYLEQSFIRLSHSPWNTHRA